MRRRWHGAWLVAVAGWLALPLPGAAEDWELRREEDGIRVWTQPVPGSDIARFRGETVIAATTTQIRDVMRDVPRMPEWFPDCAEARTLSRERDGDLELRYVVTSTPWPVDDRDAVYRFETRRDPSGSVHIAMGVDPDAHPRQDGRVRVVKAAGAWTLTPVDGGTKVVWELHLEPGGSLPAWLINQRVVDTPFRALRGLRERTASDT